MNTRMLSTRTRAGVACTLIFVVTAVFVAAAPERAAANESAAASLNKVTVIGDPIPPTAPGIEAARAEAQRVPGGASVVGSEEYADGRAGNLLDMFALSAGVFVQPRFGAEEARLSIRGSGLQRTFHLRGIYLLQDGVPLTLADGGGDFQAVEPLALAYTEVLRGANALEYGGTTLGGSINFVSPSGYDGAGMRSRAEGGSFGYRRVLLGLGDKLHDGARLDKTDYFVSASAYGQDGFRDWSRQKNARLSGNVGVRFSDEVDSRFYFGATHSDSQLPGSLTKAQLAADSTAANAGNLAGRQKRDYDLYRLASRTVFELDRRTVELSLGYSYKDLWHPIFQVLQQRSNDYIAQLRYIDEHTLAGRNNRMIFGLAPSRGRLEDDRFVNVAGERGARTAQSRQTSENFAIYAEDQFDIAGDWTLVAGAQWTRAQRRYEDFFLTNGNQSLDVAYTRLSPKLGFLWHGGEHWTLFGNVSDSFEPPSFGELSGGPGVDLLDAQHARTVEIGTRGHVSRLQWDIVGYSAQVRDELLSLNTPTGQPLGTTNAPRTVHRGIEAGWTLALAGALSWRSSYLLNHFRFDDNASYGNNPLPGIAKQLYRSELTWAPHPDYFIALSGEWSPERYAIDMANTWFTDSYALWGVKIGRSSHSGLSWFVEGRNLSDKRYAATTGVIADARGLDTAQFLPGEGRAVYAGIEWKR